MGRQVPGNTQTFIDLPQQEQAAIAADKPCGKVGDHLTREQGLEGSGTELARRG
jgi:hypothetical protein